MAIYPLKLLKKYMIDHFYSQEVSHIDGRQGSFLASYKELLECVEKQMKSYLRDMSVAKQYYEWIDRLVAFAIDWRENDRCFLLKMASNHLPQNGCFGKAVRDVGTPLISNNNPGKYYKVIPYGIGLEMDVEYFKVFYEIEKVFEYASTECSLYEWCTRSIFMSRATSAGQREKAWNSPWWKQPISWTAPGSGCFPGKKIWTFGPCSRQHHLWKRVLSFAMWSTKTCESAATMCSPVALIFVFIPGEATRERARLSFMFSSSLSACLFPCKR